MAPLLNPDTNLSHFPPGQAEQFEATSNITLAVLGALIWDILIYIADDIKIVRKSPLRMVTICFMSSRLFALAFVTLGVVEFTRPVENCNMIVYCIGVVCILTVLSTTFIFLQRIMAVYAHNRWVQTIAITLWIATTASMCFSVFDAKSIHVPGTKYCAYADIGRPLIGPTAVFAGFDTFVFLAISYQIATSHSDSDVGISWETVLSGRALPRLSRAVLQGGQQYYLITVCLQIAVEILIAIPSISPTYRVMLSFPIMSLSASMACRIFRNMKKHEQILLRRNHPLSDIKFASPSDVHKSTLQLEASTRPNTRHMHDTVPVTFPKTSTETSSSENDHPN